MRLVLLLSNPRIRVSHGLVPASEGVTRVGPKIKVSSEGGVAELKQVRFGASSQKLKFPLPQILSTANPVLTVGYFISRALSSRSTRVFHVVCPAVLCTQRFGYETTKRLVGPALPFNGFKLSFALYYSSACKLRTYILILPRRTPSSMPI